MREIKFRFWDPYEKKMIYHGYEHADCYFHGLLVCEGDTIPMQYTGLNDKNGKEIYENDLVRYKGIYYKVIWLDAGFYLKGDGPADQTPLYSTETFEVIGNTYENPELT